MSLDLYLVAYADTGAAEPYRCVVWRGNVTHNLAAMAEAAGLYRVLWRPEECDPPVVLARDALSLVRAGLATLVSHPSEFRKHNPGNGWGSYEGLVRFTTEFLAACEEHPLAKVEADR